MVTQAMAPLMMPPALPPTEPSSTADHVRAAFANNIETAAVKNPSIANLRVVGAESLCRPYMPWRRHVSSTAMLRC